MRKFTYQGFTFSVSDEVENFAGELKLNLEIQKEAKET